MAGPTTPFTFLRHGRAIRANAIVAPAIEYFGTAMEGKRGAQLNRMRIVRIFNPLHVLGLGSPLTASDVDALDAFRFYEHPKLKPAQERQGQGHI